MFFVGTFFLFFFSLLIIAFDALIFVFNSFCVSYLKYCLVVPLNKSVISLWITEGFDQFLINLKLDFNNLQIVYFALVNGAILNLSSDVIIKTSYFPRPI